MDTFPERQASFEKLYLTLDRINDAEAEKTYNIGMQYKKMKKVISAEYYLGKVPQRWPNSPWAVKAKTELAAAREDAAQAVQAQQDHHPAGGHRSLHERRADGRHGRHGRHGHGRHGHGRHGRHGYARRDDVMRRIASGDDGPRVGIATARRGGRVGRVAWRSVASASLARRLRQPADGTAASGASDEGGFLGWHMQAPFDTSEVKTVFVYFKSQRFRRDLQLMLEESVAKEISMRTPYRVVGTPDKADSILEGVITVDDKNLVVEAPTNLPRQITATMTVWINWKHNPPLESEINQQPTQSPSRSPSCRSWARPR